MPIARLTLELEIHQAHSLKDRRQVVRSLKDTLRRGFNASVAEMDEALLHNRATIAVAAISPSRNYLAGQLAAIERTAHRICNGLGAVVTDSYAELFDESDSDLLTSRDPDRPSWATPGMSDADRDLCEPDHNDLEQSHLRDTGGDV